MKQLEIVMETNRFYLKLLDICSIILPCKRQRDTRILPMYASNVTHRRWLRPVKFALEGTVKSEVDMPGISHIPIGIINME
jgi:hypothetical protein